MISKQVMREEWQRLTPFSLKILLFFVVLYGALIGMGLSLNGARVMVFGLFPAAFVLGYARERGVSFKSTPTLQKTAWAIAAALYGLSVALMLCLPRY